MTGATCVTGATFWLVELQVPINSAISKIVPAPAGVAKKLHRLHKLHRRLRAGGRGHEARWAGPGCCTSSRSARASAAVNSGRTRRWRCCWAMNCRRRRRRVISWRNSMPRICRCCKEGKSSVPTESAPLLSLAKANAERVLDMQCRRPVKTAMLDVDATVIACDKRAARGL